MKWWQASLSVVLLFLAFATITVVWHWYIATGLPLAAVMRHFYLSRSTWGNYRFVAIPDWLIPVSVLAAVAGAAGRQQRSLFVIIHSLWLAAGTVALFPLYIHWIHPKPPDWREYPIKWNVVTMTYLFNLVCIGLCAFAVRGNLRKQFEETRKEKAAQNQSQSGGPISASVISGRNSQLGKPSVFGSDEPEKRPPAYTPQQIDGNILLMCARGWSIEQAAENFRITPEELRERWWTLASRCTPAQISAILGIMREKGWTVEETAMRFRLPEEMLRKGTEGNCSG